MKNEPVKIKIEGNWLTKVIPYNKSSYGKNPDNIERYTNSEGFCYADNHMSMRKRSIPKDISQTLADNLCESFHSLGIHHTMGKHVADMTIVGTTKGCEFIITFEDIDVTQDIIDETWDCLQGQLSDGVGEGWEQRDYTAFKLGDELVSVENVAWMTQLYKPEVIQGKVVNFEEIDEIPRPKNYFVMDL